MDTSSARLEARDGPRAAPQSCRAREVLSRIAPESGPLLDSLERELRAMTGVEVPREAWDLSRVPDHLKITYRVVDRRNPLAEGKDLGFINEVVPEGQALEAAKRWAAQILECSPMAIRASKQSVYRSLDEPTLQAAMTTTYPAVKANLESQDYIEGPRAFAERRKPNWQNR